jgi:hypothetical protein
MKKYQVAPHIKADSFDRPPYSALGGLAERAMAMPEVGDLVAVRGLRVLLCKAAAVVVSESVPEEAY